MKRQETGPMKAMRPADVTKGMKESKSDHTNLTSHQRKGITKSQHTASPLGKTYISRSQENLSTHQKKKLAAYIDRPKSSLGLPKKDTTGKHGGVSNKENVNVPERDKTGQFLKPTGRPAKSASGLTPIRKASSTQHIDKSGIATSTPKSPYTNKVQSMKRAHSSHNVSKEKLSRKRTSAPADVMAYNAELLAKFEKDKKLLESRISELIQVAEGRKAEIEKYKYETKRLKEQIPSHDVNDELEFLRKENKLFKEQLIELGYPVEQITDSEKLEKKANKTTMEGSTCCNCGMPKSKSMDSLSTDGARAALSLGGNEQHFHGRSASLAASEPAMSLADVCGTPEHPSMFSMECGNWEKGSNKSSDALSEISVACLTERILQMEESHYSTNEELQATLQELGDLQTNVNELNDENEKLLDEKNLLLESLCTQTEKLEHCRIQIEQLKALLISGNFPERSEREKQLFELLKSAQEEREELLRKQGELANALHTAECESREFQDVLDAVRDKSQLLEDKNSTLKVENDNLDRSVTEYKKNLADNQIEVDHLKTLLENEKTKLQELEQYCKAADSHTDLEELLHTTRQEKDKLEDRVADMKDTVLHLQCEITRLKETLGQREEELKVSKNNAKTELSDLRFQVETLQKGKSEQHSEVEMLRQHVDTLAQDCQRYLEEKGEYSVKLKEKEKELESVKARREVVESELNTMKSLHTEESEEWMQFQKDLQTAVLVANNFRAETQEDMEKVQQENIKLREKCKVLEEDVNKLREEMDRLKLQRAAGSSSTPKSILSSAELKGKVISTVDRELLALRENKRHDNKNQSQSVKSLIQSIEEQVKSGCSSIHSSTCNSRRNSESSVDDALPGIQRIHQMVKSPTSPISENSSVFATSTPDVTLRSVLRKTPEKPSPLRHSASGLTFDPPRSPIEPTPKSAPPTSKNDTSPTITSILSRGPRRSSGVSMDQPDRIDRKESVTKDPLSVLAKQMGGSKRNALLKWCQQKTLKYSGVDITNFSSSWNDGLAFCALLHSYLPDKIPYSELNSEDKRRNFNLAFTAAESVGISSSVLNINDMVAMERPDWQAVMAYVTSIYKYFEIDSKAL
ncbi:hypothetical protein FSP39_003886 [Pinctada imbricata]|uniref:Calponin-homology (CH) domain-containing protein n=1 Tax=Pinctada imbricata TaxID=66713 RepID=A0AA88XME8_PINIB|nr:hypothetical protein FSP39_003886 [Pinctada imbricata]